MLNSILFLVLILLLNAAVSMVVGALIPNYYLASMVTSIILSFIFAILNTNEDRLHFYKQRNFYLSFLGTAILFLLLDCLFFII